MSILNSFLVDMCEQLAQEAGHLVRANRRATLTSRDIQTAVRLVLPGELAKHAVFDGVAAVTRFQAISGGADAAASTSTGGIV